MSDERTKKDGKRKIESLEYFSHSFVKFRTFLEFLPLFWEFHSFSRFFCTGFGILHNFIFYLKKFHNSYFVWDFITKIRCEFWRGGGGGGGGIFKIQQKIQNFKTLILLKIKLKIYSIFATIFLKEAIISVVSISVVNRTPPPTFFGQIHPWFPKCQLFRWGGGGGVQLKSIGHI